MTYVATINVPGYLPTDDDPPTFDTPREAWEYLASERRDAEDWPRDDTTVTESMASPTLELLHKRARWAASGLVADFEAVGTVVGDTPGYDGDHDLGLAYTVSEVEG